MSWTIKWLLIGLVFFGVVNHTASAPMKPPTLSVSLCTDTHYQSPKPVGVWKFENFHLQLYEVQCKIV